MPLLLPTLIFLFVLALLFRIDLYFTVVWFLFGAYALSRLWTRRAVRRLWVSRDFLDRAYTGDEVPVSLRVRNEGRLPLPWLEVAESVPIELRGLPFSDQVVSVGPHAERRFDYTLRCRRRGLYRLGPLRVETGDVLGVEQRVLTVEEPRRLIVYPRVVSLERLGLPTRSALVALPSRMPLFEDTTRIMGVRSYAPGDPPRRMHWTASARTGSLMVKQYQPAIARETLICLDLDLRDYEIRNRADAVEEAIVVAASLASHMIVRERLPSGLATEAYDALSEDRRRLSVAPHSERSHLMRVLEILARVQPAAGMDEIPGADFARLLREETFHLSWGATVVVVTGAVAQQLAETLVYLKRGGHAVGLILVQPPFIQGRDAPPAGIPVHRVWTDRDMAALETRGVAGL